MSEESSQSKLNEKTFGELLNVVAHCALDSFEEMVPFDEKPENEREELLRVAMKSLEIATVVSLRFFDTNTLDTKAVGEINKALEEKNYEEANRLLSLKN